MKKTESSLLAIILLILPEVAAACGVCMYSQFEYAMPHSGAWYLGMMIWFCAMMIITAGRKGIPSLIITLLLALLAGAMFLGPFAFIFLGFTAFFFTVQSCLPKARQRMSKGSQIALKIVSLAAIIAMLVGLQISAQTKRTRSDADFILRWRSGAVLQSLTSDPKKNEETLREILAKTKDKFIARQASDALAKIDEGKQKQPLVPHHD
ncbi:MAG TPA: hypothetical protein VLS94_08535 [Fusibacter sp.]|nr:hypothetical protein [Fusibacter sp.]